MNELGGCTDTPENQTTESERETAASVDSHGTRPETTG
jgi:hypothetical protein